MRGRSVGAGFAWASVGRLTLQASNLGNFATADRLFAQAQRRVSLGDPVGRRLLRNYRAIHQLNMRRADATLTELERPVGTMENPTDSLLGQGVISPGLADAINREGRSLRRIGGIDERLTPAERAEILDAQATQLRGIALRLRGENAAAKAATAIVRIGSVSGDCGVCDDGGVVKVVDAAAVACRGV